MSRISIHSLKKASATPSRTCHLNRPAPMVMRIAPAAPIDSASVGAAMPPTMLPSTATTSMTGGTTTFRNRIHSCRRLTASRSACGSGGIRSGSSMPGTSKKLMQTPAVVWQRLMSCVVKPLRPPLVLPPVQPVLAAGQVQLELLAVHLPLACDAARDALAHDDHPAPIAPAMQLQPVLHHLAALVAGPAPVLSCELHRHQALHVGGLAQAQRAGPARPGCSPPRRPPGGHAAA